MPRGRPRKNADLIVRSAEFIGWALGGLEREIAQTRERLATLTTQANQLRARVTGAGETPARGPAASASFAKPAVTGRKTRRRRSRMSAEGRKRISEMMKKRWAERRKAKEGKK